MVSASEGQVMAIRVWEAADGSRAGRQLPLPVGPVVDHSGGVVRVRESGMGDVGSAGIRGGEAHEP